jgi:hypothetical protein
MATKNIPAEGDRPTSRNLPVTADEEGPPRPRPPLPPPLTPPTPRLTPNRLYAGTLTIK